MADDLVDEQGRVIGDGHCPVNACTTKAKPGHLMCGRHWQRVPRSLRTSVNMAYAEWQVGLSTLGELRAVQQEAIDAASENPPT